jgi:hypothetical protein
MSESRTHVESAAMKQIRQHQFVTLIVGSILISFFLVYVALSLYSSSGTLQLDLSRPGYAEAREEATKDDELFRGFSASGPINEESLAEFERLYAEKEEESSSVDAYGGQALSDDALLLVD